MQENLTANRKGKDTTMRKNSTIKRPALQVIGAICILCLLLSIWPPAAADAAASSGSEETYVTTVYNDRNGLPTGEANTLLQTADGYLWFGSYGGLVRYDGSTFRNYSQEGLLLSSSIRSLYEDSQNRLWIGTNDAGVFLLENDSVSQITGPDDHSFLCIRDFIEGEDGTIYVASSSGMGEIRDGVLMPYTAPDVLGRTVYSLGVDARGRLWGAMDGGICAVMEDGTLVETVTSDRFFSDSNAQIYCVTSDNEGQIYLGTSGNVLAKLSVKGDGFTAADFDVTILQLEGVTVHNRICVTDSGDILVCGFRGFGWISADGTQTVFPESEKATSVNWAARDYEGDLWLASSDSGVIKYTPGCFTSPNEKAGLEGLTVNTIARLKNRYYVGTDQGIRIYDKNWNEKENQLTDMLQQIRVRHILPDSSGRVWIATYSSFGAVCYDPKNGEITCYSEAEGLRSNSVRTLLELSDGTIAVGTQNGANLIHDGAITASFGSEDGMENTSILCMTEGNDGELLLGSDGGGIYGIRGNQITCYGFGQGLEEGVVLRMLPDSEAEGKGFFVSAGSSLYYWDTQTFRKLTQFQKGAGSIFDLYERDGTVWILQNSGIYGIDKTALLSGEETSSRLYGFSHGLTGSLNANTWNDTDSDGSLLMATRNGISQFYFRGVDNRIPIGIIQTVQADGQLFDHPEEISLEDYTQRLTISFSALAYRDTSEFEIAYQLEGFDEEEIILKDQKTGSVSYTNLPGGSYNFRLRIYDPNNPENAYSASLRVQKEKSLKEKPVFWILMVLAIAALVALLTRLIMQKKMDRIQEQKKAYQQIVDQSMTTFAKTIDAKDPYTNGHSLRVAWYSREIARRMGLSEQEQENTYYIALLHDIGKIGVPDQILNKPAKLTEDEWHIIQNHVTVGGDILKNFTALDGIEDGARYHHERFDGNGYCEKKQKDEIPLTARIICVADTYDAMASDRCYRKALPEDVIRAELEKGAGTQFDPEIVPYMLQMMDEGIAPVQLS